jgi:hypothetical protein
MNTCTHEEVAQRAYQIWQDSGCPSGRDEEFWLQAEKQILDGGNEDSRPASRSMVDRLRSETAAESIAEFHISPPVSVDQAVNAALQKKPTRQSRSPFKSPAKEPAMSSGKPGWNRTR